MAMSKAAKLPEEIIIDILSLLPAKFIGQYRCVSKQWCNLLSDPQFIKSHQTIHAHKGEEKLIYVSWYRELQTITFNHNPQNGTIDAISRKLSFQQLEDNWVSVAGSCNGFVLVVNDEEIKFLINPTTLGYFEIPQFDLALPVPGSFSMYGLGYDVVSGDYKVVTLSYYDTDNEYEPDIDYTFVDVYYVRKDIWRRLESSPYDHVVPQLASGVLVNGALHWLASSKTSGYSSVIVAFDLSDDKFLEVPAPSTLDKGNFVFNKLVALRGCLCMFTDTEENRIDAWIMKEYGVEESWTKFSITVPKSLYGFLPLCLMSDDDVVLDGEKLIVYNMKEEQWRDMKVDGVTAKFRRTRTFVESLVSPMFGEGTEGYNIA